MDRALEAFGDIRVEFGSDDQRNHEGRIRAPALGKYGVRPRVTR
jgi:hypothetical protein